MIPKTQLSRWLDTLPADAMVAVDEGGLTLVVVNDSDYGMVEVPQPYLEVGGEPLPEEDDT